MHRRRAAGVLLVALTVGLTTQPAAAASGYSSDKTKPDLSAALAAFNYGWSANGKADLSGTVGLAPPLRGEHWGKLGADRGYLPMVLVHGLSGLIKVNGQPFVGSMPPFGTQFDDAALAAIATHVRKLQGATDAAISADDVKAERAKAGSPPQSRLRRVQILGG